MLLSRCMQDLRAQNFLLYCYGTKMTFNTAGMYNFSGYKSLRHVLPFYHLFERNDSCLATRVRVFIVVFSATPAHQPFSTSKSNM
jgi:hypothetical protein